MKKILYFLIIIAAFAASCQKTKSGNGSTLDLIRDSVYLYAAEDYYWYNQLPTYAQFNPRGYTATQDIDALTDELNALSQYAINPATNEPYEYYSPDPGEAKYSFIDNGQTSTALNGTHGDFGFAPIYNQTNDLRIKYVYPGSPADLAGIKRGYQITTINGNSSFAYDGPNGTNTTFVINSYSNSATISMTLLKPDGTTMNVSLAVANYTVNPVITYKVFNQGNGHIVGYMVFNSFTADANADPQLNAAFNYFTANGVTDLVVDLRYNGGGYVSTAEYLDNLIVPAVKNGTLMYNTYFNSTLQTGKEVLLAHQWRRSTTGGADYNYAQVDYSVAGNVVNFSKKGLLNVNRVFFIVTGATASAAELTMNNLLPEMNVQFIGSTTYGKPVGFFDIDINVYQMYTPEFATMNAANQGGYYTGMTPGTTSYPGVQDFDDPTKDFGDPSERLLAHALNYVTTGTYSVTTPQVQSVNAARSFSSIAAFNTAAVILDHRKFNGMVFNKKFKLKK